MVSSAELLKQGRRDEFWQRYCGFFDLTSAGSWPSRSNS